LIDFYDSNVYFWPFSFATEFADFSEKVYSLVC